MTWTPPEPAYKSFMVCNKCGYTGEIMEPHKRRDGTECYYTGSRHPATYTLDQLLAVIQEALEEVAKAVMPLDCAHRCGIGQEIATTIRAMKEQK